MKPDELSDAIGFVDEPLIEEADRARCVVHRDRRWWMQWVAIAFSPARKFCDPPMYSR